MSIFCIKINLLLVETYYISQNNSHERLRRSASNKNCVARGEIYYSPPKEWIMHSKILLMWLSLASHIKNGNVHGTYFVSNLLTHLLTLLLHFTMLFFSAIFSFPNCLQSFSLFLLCLLLILVSRLIAADCSYKESKQRKNTWKSCSLLCPLHC